MRLALVHRHFGTSGGTERYLSALVGALVDAQVEIHLFAARFQGPLPRRHGLFCHKVPWLRGHYGLKAQTFDYFAQRMVRRIAHRVGPFDVVQSLTKTRRQDIWRAGGGAHGAYLAAMDKRPGLSDRLVEALEGDAYLKSGHVIAPSRQVATELAERWGPRPGIHIWPNPVDIHRFSPKNRIYRSEIRRRHGIGENALLALFVGTGFARKGLMTAIEGVAQGRARGADWHLMALGADRDISAYQSRAAALKLPLILPGPRLEIERYYSAADLFILPTHYEPCSNATLEALASGLPVMTTAENGAVDGLPGQALHILMQRDAQGIARGLKLAESEAWRLNMGVEARKIAQPLNWASHVKQVLGLYEEVAREAVHRRGGRL